MLIELMRYVKGYVKFKTENGIAERLINEINKEGLSVFHIRKADGGIVGYIGYFDYERLLAIANRLNIDVLKLYERGMTPFVLRYKYRFGLFAGILIFAMLLSLSQYFIWEIDVKGNEKTPTDIILSELSELGIEKMSFIPKIDFRQKREEALVKLPQLSWMTMNRIGCKLEVIVNERVFSPKIDEKTPCDIVAGKTGIIRYIEVYNGTKKIKENCPVVEGDLIVASRYETKNGKVMYVHSDAKVIAEVEFDKLISVDVNELSKEYTGETKTIYGVNLFGFKIPFGVIPSAESADIEAISYPIHLLKKELPFGILKFNIRPFDRKAEDKVKTEAKEIIRNAFLQYEATELKDAVILKREEQTSFKNNIMAVKVKYLCEENIAKKVILDESELNFEPENFIGNG